MNHSAYIFGNFERGYSQYPDDYAVSIFQDPQFSSLKANTQIAIHKDGNLIYYAYYRVLKNNQYIGLSLVFNGVFCKDIEKLFHLFEESITGLAVSGKIIEFSESGDLHTKATKLYLEKAEIDKTMQMLDLSVNQLPSSDFKPLPPVNLGVEKSDIFSVSSSDFNKHSVELLSAHNKLLVLKNQDYDSAQMSGFSKMLNSLYKEKLRLQEENNNLIRINDELKKQKKQYRLVLFLAIILMGCVVGLIAFNNNVENLRTELKEKKSIITSLQSDIDGKNDTIMSLNSTVSIQKKNISKLDTKVTELNAKIEELEEDEQNLRNSLANLPPLLINDVKLGSVNYSWDNIKIQPGERLVSSDVLYLYPKISYVGIRSETIDLTYKIYKSGVQKCSVDTEIFVSEGGNTYDLRGYGNNDGTAWASGDYRIEIWYRSSCIYNKSFTIH